jgi:hypothetical protein
MIAGVSAAGLRRATKLNIWQVIKMNNQIQDNFSRVREAFAAWWMCEVAVLCVHLFSVPKDNAWGFIIMVEQLAVNASGEITPLREASTKWAASVELAFEYATVRWLESAWSELGVDDPIEELRDKKRLERPEAKTHAVQQDVFGPDGPLGRGPSENTSGWVIRAEGSEPFCRGFLEGVLSKLPGHRPLDSGWRKIQLLGKDGE